MKNNTQNTMTKVQINQLRILPPDLRLMIFKSLVKNWDGRVPNVIKALRGDWEVYHEVLEEFYRDNVFVIHQGNGWSFGDMTKEAVKRIRRARVVVETGIMHTGLWKVGSAKDDSDNLTPPLHAVILAAIADATNIRQLVVEFKAEPEHENILPFVAFGQVTFSLNYFVAPFKSLKRVEMVLPRRSVTMDPFVVLLREKKLEYGIKITNSKMRTVGRLDRVAALNIDEGLEEEDSEFERDEFDGEAVVELEAWDRWFWVPDGEWYLGEDRARREAVSVEAAMSDLSLNDENVWRT